MSLLPLSVDRAQIIIFNFLAMPGCLEFRALTVNLVWDFCAFNRAF